MRIYVYDYSITQVKRKRIMMEKQIGSITWTETDNGFKIEATGDKFKKMAECGCLPLMGGCSCNCNCNCKDDCCDEKGKKTERCTDSDKK